jgi:hypothetical protein
MAPLPLVVCFSSFFPATFHQTSEKKKKQKRKEKEKTCSPHHCQKTTLLAHLAFYFIYIFFSQQKSVLS